VSSNIIKIYINNKSTS